MDLLRRSIRAAGAVLAVAALAAGPTPGAAQLLLTQEEALEGAFGAGAVLERRTAYLDDAQAGRVAELAGQEAFDQRVVTYYVASRDGRAVGVAWFDAHRVRTLSEVLMIAADTAGRVLRVEVLRFAEPPEYLAPEGWLAQFNGRALDADLSLKGDIVGITGATLTSEAVTGAVRRALALQEVVAPFGDGA